ncbi:MAG: biotin-dependent carboxyltransferase family protein [Alicyclobacillaceae bacterium]|nr:biotin-dependent carboxyltransferase family protein [Alicyclobacillaceae bacterium]
MKLRILRPGLLTTVQDLGRPGLQQYGVTAGGALDPAELRTVNGLVGNEGGEAGLEITLVGPAIRFDGDGLIAIGGADLQPEIGGEPVPLRRAVLVRSGAVLRFGRAVSGCRAYLAVAGGIDVPKVMGSRSTDLRASVGGLEGRPLREGDELSSGRLSPQAARIFRFLEKRDSGRPFTVAPWFLPDSRRRAPEAERVVRAMRGRHFEEFDAESRRAFFSRPYVVTPQSNRMGYRLDGPLLHTRRRVELVSEAVCTGTVQVPPEGRPIVLLADRQTTGGYPEIAQVAAVDLPVIAQMKPGERLRFREVAIDEAQALLMEREAGLKRLNRILAVWGQCLWEG